MQEKSLWKMLTHMHKVAEHLEDFSLLKKALKMKLWVDFVLTELVRWPLGIGL